MKLKKVVSALLVGTMLLSCVACGNSNNNANNNSNSNNNAAGTETGSNDGAEATGDGKLVIWTLAKDLETFADKYMEENPDVDIETVVIEPADYVTKVQTALNGGATEPDIIVGEPQMLEDMFDAGYFEDLNQAPYNAQDYADQIVDYVWEVGQDADGIQRAISYQITPAGFYYRRDIAETIFGTSDPEEVGKLFKDYATILDTAQKVKAAGPYRLFASDSELSFFSGQAPWVVDNTLNVDQVRYDYMDLVVELYQQDLTAYAAQWATPWYQPMSGPVPLLTAETQWGNDDLNVWDATQFASATEGMDTVEVMAYGLPAWGVLTLRDNVGETSGKWGVCSGPAPGFSGGTYIGISSLSERKDTAWDFVKFCTLNEDTADWWIEVSEGDTVSLISALEKHADDENEVYGGQKLYQFWMDAAEDIDYSIVTRYDKAIGDAWGNAISNVKNGTMSKEDAINAFYDEVAATYPELTINRE